MIGSLDGMSPLDRLAACAGKMLAQIEMWFPGFDDDALEEVALVDAEAESEVHEPAPRTAATLGIDERDAVWKSVVGTLWRWDSGRWWHSYEDQWEPAPHDFWPQDTGPFTAVDTEVPEMDWHGWAVPAILEVLSEHYIERPTGICRCGDGLVGDLLSDWREHVAPLIADRIACDPERALNALRNDRLHR